MSEFKGTPGPWKANKNSVVFNGYALAFVPNYKEHPYARCIADAQLISAAPDLLASCLEIREAIKYFSEYALPIGWAERIDAAINKALGKL